MIESVDKNFMEAREQLTKDNAEVPFTTRHKVAYSFRVMCSHARSKLKRWTKGADVVPPEFRDIFNSLRGSAVLSETCPFVSFRADANECDQLEENDEDEDDEHAAITYFDNYTLTAYQLYTNGELVEPLWFEASSEGFVVAVFENDVRFQTEIVNSRLIDGIIVQTSIN